ncbi:hypothetical protein BCL93_107181 [Onishia taeanensis]|uniref:Uncharacterized protein n=1 Tax=Onishia taeanensis TaxID=284577 RepID=A0A328XTD1_9GAMM|nr:hypothetical protein BCL93_107181 [Halomonas taeanensis]
MVKARIQQKSCSDLSPQANLVIPERGTHG